MKNKQRHEVKNNTKWKRKKKKEKERDKKETIDLLKKWNELHITEKRQDEKTTKSRTT